LILINEGEALGAIESTCPKSGDFPMAAKTQTTPAFPVAPSLADVQKFFSDTARMQAQAYSALMRYQIEMLGFLKHRFEQDVKLVDDLTESKAFNDAFDVVTDFMQNAATQYTAEAGKVASLGSKLSSETARRVRKQASEMVEDLAAKTVVG
jgi:hypothetical protein